jgi:hypothetical protein
MAGMRRFRHGVILSSGLLPFLRDEPAGGAFVSVMGYWAADSPSFLFSARAQRWLLADH